MGDSNLPIPEAKLGFLEWLANNLGLPFALPKLALPQTVKNADKAFGRLIAASFDNVSGRIERNTAVRAGKAQSELEVIKAAASQLLEQSRADPLLLERALEFAFGDTVLKQRNREQVGRLAIEHLNASTTDDAGHAGLDATAEISDDWLNAFSDNVSAKSDADIQSLWAKILANEIRKPRSFSLQSLHLLAGLGADDARLLHDNVLPLVIAEAFIFSQQFPDLSDLIRAEELGVVTGSSSISLNWNITVPVGSHALSSRGGTIMIEIATETDLPIPAIMLTRFGKELLKLSNDYLPPPPDYIDRFCKFLQSRGLNVRKA